MVFPVYRKSKGTGRVIMFTSSTTGVVINLGPRRRGQSLGHESKSMADYKDTAIWTEVEEKDIYPIYAKSVNNGAILKFTAKGTAEIVVEGTNAKKGAGGYRELTGYKGDGWTSWYNKSNWILVEKPEQELQTYLSIYDIPKTMEALTQILELVGERTWGEEYCEEWVSDKEAIGILFDADDDGYGTLGMSTDVQMDCFSDNLSYTYLDYCSERGVEPLGPPKIGTQEYLEYWRGMCEKNTVYIHVGYRSIDRDKCSVGFYLHCPGLGAYTVDIGYWGLPNSLEDKAFSLSSEPTDEIREYLNAYFDRVETPPVPSPQYIIPTEQQDMCSSAPTENKIEKKEENKMKNTATLVVTKISEECKSLMNECGAADLAIGKIVYGNMKAIVGRTIVNISFVDKLVGKFSKKMRLKNEVVQLGASLVVLVAVKQAYDHRILAATRGYIVNRLYNIVIEATGMDDVLTLVSSTLESAKAPAPKPAGRPKAAPKTTGRPKATPKAVTSVEVK